MRDIGTSRETAFRSMRRRARASTDETARRTAASCVITLRYADFSIVSISIKLD